MILKKATFCLLLLMAAHFIALSQETKVEEKAKPDTSKEEINDNIFYQPSELKDWAKEYVHPTINLFWGYSKPSMHQDAFSGTFSDIGLAQLNIGVLRKAYFILDKDVVVTHEHNLFLANISGNIPPKPEENGTSVESESWQFGYQNSQGFGYKLGESSDIVLYHTEGLCWTKVNFKDTAAIKDEQNSLDVFGDQFRFGEKWESGIKIQLFNPFALNFAYERSIVYPRHLFWYWLGSEALEGVIGDGLIDEFVKFVARKSPKSAPIAYFILRTGLSYGFYELRKGNMNWPIQTAKPLMFDNFKIGFSFTF